MTLSQIQQLNQSDAGWNFNGSDANQCSLQSLCRQVERYYHFPERRLYRFFAVQDDEFLRQANRPYYRGFHVPESGRNHLPHYLFECFFRSADEIDGEITYAKLLAFDDLIYIRDTTCADSTGCVITYAHELQHFMQQGHQPKLLTVNGVLYDNLARFEPNACTTDVPHEREANIVSKRVAESVCGVRAVREFAEQQLAMFERLGERQQAARWRFFRDVPSSTPFDLLQATLPLVERYKDRMDFKINVDQPQWWLGAVECADLEE